MGHLYPSDELATGCRRCIGCLAFSVNAPTCVSVCAEQLPRCGCTRRTEQCGLWCISLRRIVTKNSLMTLPSWIRRPAPPAAKAMVLLAVFPVPCEVELRPSRLTSSALSGRQRFIIPPTLAAPRRPRSSGMRRDVASAPRSPTDAKARILFAAGEFPPPAAPAQRVSAARLRRPGPGKTTG